MYNLSLDSNNGVISYVQLERGLEVDAGDESDGQSAGQTTTDALLAAVVSLLRYRRTTVASERRWSVLFLLPDRRPDDDRRPFDGQSAGQTTRDVVLAAVVSLSRY